MERYRSNLVGRSPPRQRVVTTTLQESGQLTRERARPATKPAVMSAKHNVAWTLGSMAKVAAPMAVGTRERASSVAPMPTKRANRTATDGVFRCDIAAKAMPQMIIHDTCAVRPARMETNRGASATLKPRSPWLPRIAKGPSQSLCRTANPMIAPPVAAAAISPARTPARIGEESTGERKRGSHACSREVLEAANPGLFWRA